MDAMRFQLDLKPPMRLLLGFRALHRRFKPDLDPVRAGTEKPPDLEPGGREHVPGSPDLPSVDPDPRNGIQPLCDEFNPPLLQNGCRDVERAPVHPWNVSHPLHLVLVRSNERVGMTPAFSKSVWITPGTERPSIGAPPRRPGGCDRDAPPASLSTVRSDR